MEEGENEDKAFKVKTILLFKKKTFGGMILSLSCFALLGLISLTKVKSLIGPAPLKPNF